MSRRILVASAISFRILTLAIFATAAPNGAMEDLSPLEQVGVPQVLTLRGEMFHVQGLEVDEDFIYATSVDTRSKRGFLHKLTRSGKFVARIDLTDGERYHPGGIARDGESIWIPVAEYTPQGTSRIVQVDRRTLKVVSSFIVHDHIGAVTANAATIYGANWDARRFYEWDHRGAEIAEIANPTQVAYQDVKFVGGELVAGGVMRGQFTGAIDWLDPVTLQPRLRLSLGKTPQGQIWTREGMAVQDGKLYLLPHDGHNGQGEVFVFSLDALKKAATRCASLSAGGYRCIDETVVAAGGP